jgi:hypothetical protein
MNFARLALLGIAVTTMTACTTTQGVPNVVTNRPAPVARPDIAPMDLENVRWVVRDVAGLRALADSMEASGQKDVVFYVLDQDSYNALAMNIAEVRRYINDQDAANDFLLAAIDTNSRAAVKPEEKKPAAEKPRKRKFGIF